MGRPDRCSARRGDSAQRRRVSANDLLVDERDRWPRSRCARAWPHATYSSPRRRSGRSPGRRPTARGGRAWRRRARRPGARGGGGRSATSRGSDGAPTVRPVISTVRRRGGAASAVGTSGARTDGPWSSPREKRPRRSGPDRSKRRGTRHRLGLVDTVGVARGDRVAGMALGHRASGSARVKTQAATGLLLALALERFAQVLHVVPPRAGVGLGHAGVAVLFRVLTGLADGLALKELALRVGRRDSPQLRVPRFPTLSAPKHGRRWGTQRS